MERGMTVNELVSLVVQSGSLTGDLRLIGDGTSRIHDVTHDSRQVGRGSVFCCVVGEKFDGHDFAAEVVARGASCLVVEHEVAVNAPQIVVTDVRRAAGIIAAAFHGWPSDRLRVVGVTGTNGKTTTAQLLAAILHQSGMDPEVLGTLVGARTTPESTDLQRHMAGCVKAGKKALVMEVTSHAMVLDRVVGTRFSVGVFTNLSKDHLDFHVTEERYFAAKARLFTPEFTDRGVVNRDDVHGRLLLDTAAIPCAGFGIDDVRDVVVTPRGHSYDWRGQRVTVALGGRFNVLNSIGAAMAASELGVSDEVIARGLSVAPVVPGRFELIESGNGVAVIVDYAHDAASLARLLESAREPMARDGRIAIVFGCGGERDALKRPEMGAVAAKLADFVVLTNDNPRGEDPEAIVAQIVAGIAAEDRSTPVTVEHDRRRAIELAIELARPGDVVIVAGKGHESTQTIGDTIVPFNDAQVVREIVGLGK
jgi:UDP-N-acetylmuramoyl-L-alanyl-D-glutamate--2,6-diaminopimelate ligase